MARLIEGKVALAVREEQIVIDVLLYLHKEGRWDKACQRVAVSFLEWLIVYQDSLNEVFDLAEKNGFVFQRFSTSNPDGWREVVPLKNLNSTEAQKKKQDHRKEVVQRRSRKILASAKKIGISEDEINNCFRFIEHEPDADEKMAMMAEEIVRMQGMIDQLTIKVNGMQDALSQR